MDNVDNKQQAPEFAKDYKQINLWKISTILLLCLSLVLVALTTIKYLPNKEAVTKQKKPIETTKATLENTLFFSKQNPEQPLPHYDHALLASPDVLSEQKDKNWQPLECIYSSEERSWYTISDIKKFITDTILLKGLQIVEDNKFKITIRNAKGALLKEYTSLQNINYTEICKDSKNYYVLFLTASDKSDNQSSLFIKEVKAGGGWSGDTNFAVIPFVGETKIYENINVISKNIAVSDLLKNGFTSPTSRSFAYYGCYRLMGKLGEDLYAVCGGDGGSGLYKINLNPLTFSEVSFCWWLMSESSRVCYDTQGKRYYQYK